MTNLRFTDANGLKFAYFEEGTGPLVLLVHGFPDTAHSWAPIRQSLANAGFRVVSPFTRGYFPTEIPSDGKYDSETLGRDLLALIEALGETSAVVVGHDWGAIGAFAATQMDPTKVHFLAVVALPHSASIRTLPRIAWGLRHIVRFKFFGGAGWLTANDFANVDALVRRWSPAWTFGPDETTAIKEALRQPGCTDAVLGYYRAVSPMLTEVLKRKIEVPTLAFVGETDSVMTRADFEHARKYHAASYDIVAMPGGHFLHREDPQLFVKHLLAALPAPRATSGQAASVR